MPDLWSDMATSFAEEGLMFEDVCEQRPISFALLMFGSKIKNEYQKKVKELKEPSSVNNNTWRLFQSNENILSDADQEDASEFLILMLEGIFDENKGSKTIMKSFDDQIFFTSKMRYQCQDCKSLKETTAQVSNLINLSIKTVRGHVSMQELIKSELYSVNVLGTEDSMPKCSVCRNQTTVHNEWEEFSALPTFLFFCLKRYDAKGKKIQKSVECGSSINIPIIVTEGEVNPSTLVNANVYIISHLPQLMCFSSPDGQRVLHKEIKYYLRGIVCHSGNTLKRGHYKCYILESIHSRMYYHLLNDCTHCLVTKSAFELDVNNNGYLFLYGKERIPSFGGNPYRGHRTEFLSLEKQYLHYFRRRGIPRTAKSSRKSDLGISQKISLSQVLSNIPEELLSLSQPDDDNNQNSIEELHERTEQEKGTENQDSTSVNRTDPYVQPLLDEGTEDQDSTTVKRIDPHVQPLLDEGTENKDFTSVSRTDSQIQPLLEEGTNDQDSSSVNRTDPPFQPLLDKVESSKKHNALASLSTMPEINDGTIESASPPTSLNNEMNPKLNDNVHSYLHGCSNLDAIDVEGESSGLPYEVSSDHRGSVIKNFKMMYKDRTLQSLQPKRWLNDCAINYFMSCLNISSPKENIIVLDSQLIGTVGNDIAKMERSLHSKLHGRDLRKLSYLSVLVPLNADGGTHWVLACLKTFESHVTLYDSMQPSSMEKEHIAFMDAIMNGMDNIMKDADNTKWIATNELRVEVLHDVPTQTNGYDCGLYTCMFAKLVYFEEPFRFGQKFITCLRSFLHDHIRDSQHYFLTFKEDIWSSQTNNDAETDNGEYFFSHCLKQICMCIH
jgi:hypothetical protein